MASVSVSMLDIISDISGKVWMVAIVSEDIDDSNGGNRDDSDDGVDVD